MQESYNGMKNIIDIKMNRKKLLKNVYYERIKIHVIKIRFAKKVLNANWLSLKEKANHFKNDDEWEEAFWPKNWISVVLN